MDTKVVEEMAITAVITKPNSANTLLFAVFSIGKKENITVNPKKVMMVYNHFFIASKGLFG
ncbi:MAG: hypothetical protein CSA44_00635 [Gammaproteobacteria bacterium]|nr:MAG: hypothetical protein CSA44_00635 [Gammaproteobacteria bacterium]